MDGHETARWDVAAYALGVLDHRDIERYEQHLADCASCAAELDFLLPASRLLADVDPADVQAAEDSRLVDRLIGAVRIDRNRARRRHRITVGVGTALAAALAAFAVFAGMTWLETIPTDDVAGGPEVPATPSLSPSGDDAGEADPVSITDPETGVHIEALLESTDWGTQLSIALSQVTGPRECTLMVVHRDGTEEVVGSWRVPPDGYGTPKQPSPLLLRAATAAARADIEELRLLQVAEGDGTVVATLATLPV